MKRRLTEHPQFWPCVVLLILLVGIINNGLDLLNVSSYYQAIVKGAIIIGAVWLDRNRSSS